MGSWSSKPPSDVQRWVSLKEKMEASIFGQHIAIGEVYFRLNSHFKNAQPKKALVIICSGTLGIGKTYFCQLIANEIYDRGFNNPACKLFIAPLDFPDPNCTSAYKEKLQKVIEETVKNYPRSSFVFDEIDKAPPGMLDVLTPYITPDAVINGVDYRFSTFIFISNFGGTAINDIVLSHIQNGELSRDELMLHHFQRALKDILIEEEGGLKNSKIIKEKLIDHNVPFLPLEQEHIKQCLQYQYKVDDNALLSQVVDLLEFEPESNPIFAKEGAKNVDVQLEYAKQLLRPKK